MLHGSKKIQRRNMMKSLEKRMKRYEAVSDNMLPIRMPVIIRLDGWHFKTFTKGLVKPFDEIFREAMLQTTLHLCKELPGVVLGYTQSDEISLLISDYKSLDIDSWFDNRLNKLLSIPAGMTAVKFNEEFAQIAINTFTDKIPETGLDVKLTNIYDEKYNNAIFDARAFVIPEDDVINYFYWRQKDAIRNGIEMVGKTYLTHQELHKKSCDMIIEMLKEKEINWNEYDTWLTRGVCVYKKLDEEKNKMKWKNDKDIPMFKNESRTYLKDIIDFD